MKLRNIDWSGLWCMVYGTAIKNLWERAPASNVEILLQTLKDYCFILVQCHFMASHYCQVYVAHCSEAPQVLSRSNKYISYFWYVLHRQAQYFLIVVVGYTEYDNDVLVPIILRWFIADSDFLVGICIRCFAAVWPGLRLDQNWGDFLVTQSDWVRAPMLATKYWILSFLKIMIYFQITKIQFVSWAESVRMSRYVHLLQQIFFVPWADILIMTWKFSLCSGNVACNFGWMWRNIDLLSGNIVSTLGWISVLLHQ